MYIGAEIRDLLVPRDKYMDRLKFRSNLKWHGRPGHDITGGTPVPRPDKMQDLNGIELVPVLPHCITR
jgi:hypothetical protein